MFDFSGRRVLITGASRGVGAAVAKAFARNGATVVIAARNVEGLNKVKTDIEGEGGKVEVRPVDLSSRDACRELADSSLPIDILINNAAVTYFTRDSVMVEDDAYWDRNFAVDFFAPLVLMQRLGKGMAERGYGVVLNISSTSGQKPGPGNAPYACAKSALDMLSKAAGMELAAMGSGVRVNSLALGHVSTEALQENIGADRTPDEIARLNSPLGRCVRPSEVAAYCLFLASDEAAPILGNVINIDGGLLAGSYSFAGNFKPNADQEKH
jgi:NAD(P)-dependent dehydrogenase (short-subunit alcohol dehydrogenase family)